MTKALIICGATASGKTSLAVSCAKQLNTEVISADSQLVYQSLDIGTAKPTNEEKQGVKHHLIDVVSPCCNFSVSDYRDLALPIVEQLLQKKKIPVICGGTGFYINSLLFDLTYGGVMADEAIRHKYEELLKTEGKEKLFSILQTVDPETALKLHCNDTKRIIRALEIFEISGQKKSEQHDELIARFPYVAVAIDYPRQELYERIDKRVDIMFEDGLIEEVKKLLIDGVDGTYQCMQAIGYKEVLLGLQEGWTLSQIKDQIKINTRHYAKRQITFFKRLPNIIWLSPQQATCQTVMELLK